MSFGERLKRARRAKGLTQRRLAHQLDMRSVTISEWERGQVKSPDIDLLAPVADALDVSIEWLLKGIPQTDDVAQPDPPGWVAYLRMAEAELDDDAREFLRQAGILAVGAGLTPTPVAYSAWLGGWRMCQRPPTKR